MTNNFSNNMEKKDNDSQKMNLFNDSNSSIVSKNNSHSYGFDNNIYFFEDSQLVPASSLKNENPQIKRFKFKSILNSVVIVPVSFFVFSMLYTLPILKVYGQDMTNIPFVVLLLMTIASEISAIVFYLYIAKNSVVANSKTLLGLNNFNIKHFILSLVLGIVMFVVLQFLALTLNNVIGEGTIGSSDTSQGVLSGEGVWYWIGITLVTPFIAPVVEELIFRGVILNGMLMARVKPFVAAIVSSVIFSLVHFQGAQTFNDFFLLIWIFGLALVMSTVFIKTKSLYNTMAIHIGYNGITAFLPLILTLIT